MPSDEQLRACYRDKRNEVANATVFSLNQLDAFYTRRASEDPFERAQHAAVRDLLRQRGYLVSSG
jgi:hypothetical protein